MLTTTKITTPLRISLSSKSIFVGRAQRGGGRGRGGGGALLKSSVAIMVDGRLVLEYAKSARAACPLCGSTIGKGAVRIGREKMVNGWAQVKWHHPNCFGEHHPEADFAQMGGFSSLKAADQKALEGIRASAGKENESSMGSLHSISKNEDIPLPEGWKSFSTLILNVADDVQPSDKIAAFDFDGTLVDTSVFRQGADAWSLLYDTIPTKLESYHNQGYKLVVFTNESNIERFTKARAKAIDSKLGRLKGFMQAVKVPMQIFIACGKSGSNDVFRKPATGMWYLLENHLNAGIPIDKDRSFYVGDAAGRKTDHSDADIGFAKVLGLQFLLPEEVFGPESDASGGDTALRDQEIDKSKASHGTPSETPTETVKIVEIVEIVETVQVVETLETVQAAKSYPENLDQNSPGTP